MVGGNYVTILLIGQANTLRSIKGPSPAEAGAQAWSCEALELRPPPFDGDPIWGTGEGLADSIAASMNKQLLR